MSAVRIPGTCTSMPNCALPVIFSGLSRRRIGLPISFQSFFALSFTAEGGGSFCAASASSP